MHVCTCIGEYAGADADPQGCPLSLALTMPRIAPEAPVSGKRSPGACRSLIWNSRCQSSEAQSRR